MQTQFNKLDASELDLSKMAGIEFVEFIMQPRRSLSFTNESEKVPPKVDLLV